MYSASVDDKAISDYSFELQAIGHPAYFITNPDLLKTDLMLPESFRFQPPAKSASAQFSNPSRLFGVKIILLSLVLFKYLPILFIAFT